MINYNGLELSELLCGQSVVGMLIKSADRMHSHCVDNVKKFNYSSVLCLILLKFETLDCVI